MLKKARKWIVELDHIGSDIDKLKTQITDTLEIHVESTDTEDKEAAEMIASAETILYHVDRIQDFLRMQLDRKDEEKRAKKNSKRPTIESVFGNDPDKLKKHLEDLYDSLGVVPSSDPFVVIKKFQRDAELGLDQR